MNLYSKASCDFLPEVVYASSDFTLYVVMEYVKSGELFDYIVEKRRWLYEDEARTFFQQVGCLLSFSMRCLSSSLADTFAIFF